MRSSQVVSTQNWAVYGIYPILGSVSNGFRFSTKNVATSTANCRGGFLALSDQGHWDCCYITPFLFLDCDIRCSYLI